MKRLFMGLMAAGLIFASAPGANAASYGYSYQSTGQFANQPIFGNFYNPILALHPTGTHGIVSQPGIHHEGFDLVLRDLGQGGIKQIFVGYSEQEGLHTHVSKWSVAKNGTCKKNAVFVPNASANWGNYLLPGADYCVQETR